MTATGTQQQPHDRILGWLADLGNHSSLRASATTPKDQRTAAAKRKRGEDSTVELTPCAAKRRRLGLVSGNAQKTMGPSKGNVGARARGTKRALPDQDENATPRISRIERIHVAVDSPLSQAPVASDYSASSASLASDTQSSRSRSPQKRINATQFSSIPIDRLTLQPRHLPPEVQSLYDEIDTIVGGAGVLPRDLKRRFEEAGVRIHEHEWSRGEQDDIHSLEAEFVRAKEIWMLADICSEKKVAESRWNAEVHCQLLRTALIPQGERGIISYEDITHARISDPTLLASIRGSKIQSKLVDYAITIEDPSMRPRVIERLRDFLDATTDPSINCSSAAYIQFDPIAVNIETKKEATDTSQQELQIGVWLTAHFLKLRQLTLPQCPALPVLPALLVEGHDWRLIFAKWSGEEESARMAIYFSMPIASTNSLSGVYRVIRVLQTLGRWAQHNYRAWFEEHVLRPFESPG